MPEGTSLTARGGNRAALAWWQRGVLYQSYPRSYQDTNGDGIGDLGGILPRLDHLGWLAVDALWLSPIYPSPIAGFGYDISNCAGFRPVVGTLDDFARLLGAAHRRGLRLTRHVVPNHTSDRDPWFDESRASRTSPKRDWYVWPGPAGDGGPPNNCLATFGGS